MVQATHTASATPHGSTDHGSTDHGSTDHGSTDHAYRDFIREAGLEAQMRSHFESLNIEDLEALRQCSRRVRDLILETPFPCRADHSGLRPG